MNFIKIISFSMKNSMMKRQLQMREDVCEAQIPKKDTFLEYGESS